jgi:hypothetical protein
MLKLLLHVRVTAISAALVHRGCPLVLLFAKYDLFSVQAKKSALNLRQKDSD